MGSLNSVEIGSSRLQLKLKRVEPLDLMAMPRHQIVASFGSSAKIPVDTMSVPHFLMVEHKGS